MGGQGQPPLVGPRDRFRVDRAAEAVVHEPRPALREDRVGYLLQAQGVRRRHDQRLGAVVALRPIEHRYLAVQEVHAAQHGAHGPQARLVLAPLDLGRPDVYRLGPLGTAERRQDVVRLPNLPLALPEDGVQLVGVVGVVGIAGSFGTACPTAILIPQPLQ